MHYESTCKAEIHIIQTEHFYYPGFHNVFFEVSQRPDKLMATDFSAVCTSYPNIHGKAFAFN